MTPTSAMAMSTFHPLLPPTSNTMDPDQRTRLVRTARKLEALLGTTPQVVEIDDHLGCLSTKGMRGTVVYGSPFSSSASSLDSISSEMDYHRVRMRPGDYHQGWDFRPSHSASSSADKILLATDEKKIKKTKGPQPLAQPLLLRMSAVPASNHCRHSSHTAKPARPVPAPITVVPAPPLVTPFERRKLKVDSVLGPLSPINKSHFPSHLHSKSQVELDLPRSPSPPSEPDVCSGLSDREKRIKMAKLQRIMGANVPQELVFREPVLPTTEKTLKRRSRSMSAIKPGKMTPFSPIPEEPIETKCKGKGRQIPRPLRPLPSIPSHSHSRSLPPTPPSSSRPVPIITQTTTTTTSSPVVGQNSLPKQPERRKHRPRSLSLGNDSAIVAANIKLAQQQAEATARGSRSFDENRKLLTPDRKQSKNRVLDRSDAPFRPVRAKEKLPRLAVLKTEIWKRKEREWSGEWNVKDMDEVARALRSLKM